MNALTAQNHTGFAIDGMQGAMSLAKAMASARMVPQHLQDSPGDCLMVIEQAMRWQMSPFAVAQATAVVRGKMCFEGKLVAAAIQTSGILEGRLHYTFSGEGASRSVECSGHIRGESKPRTVEVTLASAATENQWWKKTPDQMLTYHAARVWARRHTPEVMLGVYSPDEFDDAPARETKSIDLTPEPQRPVEQEQRPIDYVAMFDARLTQCTDIACVDRQWKAWSRTVEKAKEAGRPIDPEIVERIQGMIGERMADMQERENQIAAEQAEVEAVEVPA
ncbi:recombinase RecT [Gluconacetobacter entanii]|uniref:recombinase RecT n=1 Tax=Gluconacetobacter entanii TaxID=108528 RepID=UPI001C935134|nr:recombinase RecT [Gluconacetobacter entanii]MBY4639682.1 recombinase RecT [Gluconacetobacter entanii]MCW4579192.1 recombinase RecT [Gluconacetobacter entanii]MCW4582582.1 recombinase RecT [Gluconacetobacter entanii]MCW4585969.1 recombinase RecT [Gluconacetobacter entanii]